VNKRIKSIMRLNIGLLITALLLITSCASRSTKLTSVWRDENYTGHLNKVFVIGASPNPNIRSASEREFVSQLKSLGVDAVPSHYSIFPEKMLDKDTIVSKIKDLDVNAVLITRLVWKDEQIYYGTDWYEDYKGSHRSSKQMSKLKDVTFKVETKLFDAGTEKPVWSAVSETFILSGVSIYDEVKPFIEIIVKNLSKEKFFQ
jgi:hypothetical protein